MKLVHSTELMKNQKHAVTMAPDRQFEVLQTQGGHSLFFSIGTDGVFYCTREIPADTVGWNKQNLISALAASNSGATAKNFDVFQHSDTGAIELVLVVTINGIDQLYYASGISNDDTAWDTMSITWTPLPFDDSDPTHNYAGHAISDVYITRYTGTPVIIVDILKDPTSSINIVFRYFVDPTKTIAVNHGLGTIAWIPQDLAANLEAGTIVSQQGRRESQLVDGIYTMGSLVGETEIIYTPAYSVFAKKGQPLGAPDPVTFPLPTGTTQMAVCSNMNKYTDLYLAGGGGLYYLAAANQVQGAAASCICSNPLLQGVESLHAATDFNQTILWGLNENGQVFYLSCAYGSESNPASWSVPVPVFDNVEAIATYIDSQASNGVIFAHRSDDTLVQLTRDTNTGIWQQRSILLPGTDTNDYVETYTFTTHIQCNDDTNLPLSYANVTVTPTSDCSVYINDCYHKLYSGVQLAVVADQRGVINIQQTVDSLGGVCFNIGTGAGDPESVNPMSDILAKLGNVKQGSDLDVTVTDENGNTKQLVGSNITAAQKDQIAQYIAAFLQMQSDVPSDGSSTPDAAPAAAAKPMVAAATPTAAAVPSTAVAAAVLNAAPAGFDPTQAIVVYGGDAWNWFKGMVSDVETWFVQKIGAINYFFVKIGDAYYQFALRCIHDIAQGIHFVLSQIEIAFDDLVKWLGSIFAWVDILRTHKVIKNMYNLYGNYIVSDIDTIKGMLAGFISHTEQSLNNWAGLPTDSYQSSQSSGNADNGQNSPSNNWGLHHTQGNATSATCDAVSNPLADIGEELIQALIDEGTIIASAANQMKAVFSQIGSLSIGEIFQKLLVIIADGILDSAENVLGHFLDICADLLQGVMDMLNAPLNIPVISPLYKLFAKEDLSFMDLACLVTAIPATFIYKLANGGTAPYPDNDTTNSLINATTLAEFSAVVFPPAAPAAAGALLAPAPGDPGLVKANIVVFDKDDSEKNQVFETFAFVSNCCGAVGGLAMCIMGAIKLFQVTPKTDWLFTKVTAVFYFPYVAPSVLGNMQSGFDGTGKAIANSGNVILSALGIFRALADVGWGTNPNKAAVVSGDGAVPDAPPAEGVAVDDAAPVSKFNPANWWKDASPWIDMVINLLWYGPVADDYAQSDKKAADLFNLIGGCLFNFSGFLSPFIPMAQKAELPQVEGALIFGSALCNGGYAAMCLLVDFDSQ